MALVTVQMEDYELLEMLLDRCNAWGTSENNIDLFEKMYQSYLDGGVFDNGEFNVMSIVDNDVVNYCNVITKEDCPQDFEKLLELYHQGEHDVSRERFEDISPSFIEAVSDDETRILIRY
jgi:hypothetical protein